MALTRSKPLALCWLLLLSWKPELHLDLKLQLLTFGFATGSKAIGFRLLIIEAILSQKLVVRILRFFKRRFVHNLQVPLRRSWLPQNWHHAFSKFAVTFDSIRSNSISNHIRKGNFPSDNSEQHNGKVKRRTIWPKRSAKTLRLKVVGDAIAHFGYLFLNKQDINYHVKFLFTQLLLW